MRTLSFHLKHPLTKEKQSIFFNQSWIVTTTYRIFGIVVSKEIIRVKLSE